MAALRQTPAVPLKFRKRFPQKRAGCSTAKWPSMPRAWAIVNRENARFRWPKRVWTTATRASAKCGMVVRRKSTSGTASPSKIATNSPRASLSPAASAPALNPVRSRRWRWATVPPVDREQEIGVQAIEKEPDDRDGVKDPDDDAHMDLGTNEARTG